MCVGISILGLKTYCREIFENDLNQGSLKAFAKVAAAASYAEQLAEAWSNRPSGLEYFECHPHFLLVLKRVCENMYRFAVIRSGKDRLDVSKYACAMYSLSKCSYSQTAKFTNNAAKLGTTGVALNKLSEWISKASLYEYHTNLSLQCESHPNVSTAQPKWYLAYWHQNEAYNLVCWGVEQQSNWFMNNENESIKAEEERLIYLESKVQSFKAKPERVQCVELFALPNVSISCLFQKGEKSFG